MYQHLFIKELLVYNHSIIVSELLIIHYNLRLHWCHSSCRWPHVYSALITNPWALSSRKFIWTPMWHVLTLDEWVFRRDKTHIVTRLFVKRNLVSISLNPHLMRIINSWWTNHLVVESFGLNARIDLICLGLIVRDICKEFPLLWNEKYVLPWLHLYIVLSMNEICFFSGIFFATWDLYNIRWALLFSTWTTSHIIEGEPLLICHILSISCWCNFTCTRMLIGYFFIFFLLKMSA